MKQLFVVLLSATILLCGCSADEANVGDDESGVVKKEQYAVYHDCGNNENFQISPNNNYYDAVVEQATLVAAESKSNALPEGMTRTIDLIFYQLPTEAATSSGEDMDYVPILALSVFQRKTSSMQRLMCRP